MKKFSALFLAAIMILSLVACGESKAKESEYKLGMGVSVSMESSKTGNAQVDATAAAVVTDKDGKIVACRIDVAQNKMNVTDGAVNTAATFKTKRELGDAYGMAGKVDNNGDGVMKEWYDQADAFEAYVVGMTLSQVKAIKTQEVNGHKIAVDETLLKAGCTIQITDFIDAVAAACEDEQGMTFKASGTSFKTGIAAKSSAADSKAATATEDGLVAMYTDFAATVIGSDGKILAALNDAIQPKISIGFDGSITNKAYTNTKRNLKEDYNMAKYGQNQDANGDGKVYEWYIQSEAFSKYVVGMTASEVSAIKTQENSHGYQMAVDTALLDAGCTIQISGIIAVMAQSANNAK